MPCAWGWSINIIWWVGSLLGGRDKLALWVVQALSPRGEKWDSARSWEVVTKWWIIMPIYEQGGCCFFFLYIYTTRPRYFWTQLSTLPSGLRKFEGQIHPHFWGGEVELWRHESAFLWSYGTNSPRVRFPAFQPRKAFFRPLASFTGLFWYSCHLPNIPKGPTWLWLWFQVGQQLVMWNGDLLQKGQENSRTGVSAAQVNVLCWREADSHQTSLLSLMCGSPQVTNRKDLPPSDQIAIWGTG